MSEMVWTVTKPGRVNLAGTRIYISHLFIPHAPQLLYVISDDGRVLSAQSDGLDAAKRFAESHALACATDGRRMAS